MNATERANHYINYFGKLTREQDNAEVWRTGLQAAQQWLEIINSSNKSQIEIKKLLGYVYTKRCCSSGWYSLAGEICEWVNSIGIETLPFHEFMSGEQLPFMMLEKIAYNDHAQILIKYFERYSKEDPEYPAWSLGLQVAKKWQELLSVCSITISDATGLINDLKNGEIYLCSSVWFDLSHGISKWLKDSGYEELLPKKEQPNKACT